MIKPAQTTSDAKIREALRKIKLHITADENQQNKDLHAAIQIIVTEFRKVGLLQEHGAR